MIEFRPLEESDLALLRTWLEHELAEDLTGRFVTLVDGRPAGMTQSYDEEVDLLIGEEGGLPHRLMRLDRS